MREDGERERGKRRRAGAEDLLLVRVETVLIFSSARFDSTHSFSHSHITSLPTQRYVPRIPPLTAAMVHSQCIRVGVGIRVCVQREMDPQDEGMRERCSSRSATKRREGAKKETPIPVNLSFQSWEEEAEAKKKKKKEREIRSTKKRRHTRNLLEDTSFLLSAPLDVPLVVPAASQNFKTRSLLSVSVSWVRFDDFDYETRAEKSEFSEEKRIATQ